MRPVTCKRNPVPRFECATYLTTWKQQKMPAQTIIPRGKLHKLFKETETKKIKRNILQKRLKERNEILTNCGETARNQNLSCRTTASKTSLNGFNPRWNNLKKTCVITHELCTSYALRCHQGGDYLNSIHISRWCVSRQQYKCSFSWYKNQGIKLFYLFLKGRYLLIPKYFCAVYDYAGKSDLRKSDWNPKRKLAITTHFLEILVSNNYSKKQ